MAQVVDLRVESIAGHRVHAATSAFETAVPGRECLAEAKSCADVLIVGAVERLLTATGEMIKESGGAPIPGSTGVSYVGCLDCR